MGKEIPLGHWECVRCFGRDAYESEEVTGAIAGTINVPGPVSPTFINSITSKVYRCRNCGEKSKWVDSPEEVEAKKRRGVVLALRLSRIAAVMFAVTAIAIPLIFGGDYIPVSIIPAIGSVSFYFAFLVGKESMKLESEENEPKP